MADAAIAIWESKYFYQYWRPVTGIRESDPGTGPTGAGDGNPATIGDPSFSPLGAPASNLTGPNFTPPFPSYPSSAMPGSAARSSKPCAPSTAPTTLPLLLPPTNSMGRHATTPETCVRLLPRSFSSLSQAEEENGQSRIYLGIHWVFDKSEGIAQGRRVADYVFANAFRPVLPHKGR